MSNADSTVDGRRAGLSGRDAIEHVLLGMLPVAITGLVLYSIYAHGNAAVDFRHSFWVAGWRARHGLDPYDWTRAQVAGGVSFPYPAPAAIVLLPFTLLSSSLAGVLATGACVVAAPVSLWIVGVRDWRIYGAVALWAPVVVAWQTANFTLPLVLGTAALWRWRDRRWSAAALVACLVTVKPIMAPLWVWLLLSRRWHAAALALVIGVLVNAVSWTVLGWHTFGDWLQLLSLQGRLRDGTGYSLVALAKHLGLAQGFGLAAIVCLGGALLGMAALAVRDRRERRVFCAAVLLAIVISPQIDSHYFALLLVPLALARPRLAWPWIAPLVLWACPATHADLAEIVLWWGLLAALAKELLARGEPPPAADRIHASELSVAT